MMHFISQSFNWRGLSSYMQLFCLYMAMVSVASAPYYQPLNPYSYEFSADSNSNSGKHGRASNFNNNNEVSDSLDLIEKKYVNSGQSVVLICDLPNSMPDGKVLFIKFDSRVLSSGSDIREDSDDERFEISQQYAWEWSLKINAINEDDAGIYFCKVGNTVIQKFEIVVRVPPRIKDDPSHSLVRRVREGDSVQFTCAASGTPRPTISWFAFDSGATAGTAQSSSALAAAEQSMRLLATTGNVLRIDNVTRQTPRRYQCRASNNIPPSDTRNMSFNIEFEPEVEIAAKLSATGQRMQLNCTVSAAPLATRSEWRKDGVPLVADGKYDIRHTRLNDFTLLAQLTIKYYNSLDSGDYECSGENELRISKAVYHMQEEAIGADPIGTNALRINNNKETVELVPIGSSNGIKDIKLLQIGIGIGNSITTHRPPGGKSRRPIGAASRSHHNQHQFQQQKQQQEQFFFPANKHDKQTKSNSKLDESENSASLKNIDYSQLSRSQMRKHQRNHKNTNKTTVNGNGEGQLTERLAAAAVVGYAPGSATTSTAQANYNSPYVILIGEESSSSSNGGGFVSDDQFGDSNESESDSDSNNNNNNNHNNNGNNAARNVLGAESSAAHSSRTRSAVESGWCLLLLSVSVLLL